MTNVLKTNSCSFFIHIFVLHAYTQQHLLFEFDMYGDDFLSVYLNSITIPSVLREKYRD